MFFSRPGECEACGIFTLGHLMLTTVTILCVIILLKCTIHKSKEEIKKIIKKCTIFVWIYEVIVIIFKLHIGGLKEVNSYIPLYYCSLLLYAGIFSSFGKGKIKRIGDVFLATGGIVGGLVYVIFPTTSIITYPIFHLISVHSFIFHGIMIYLGMLLNISHYIELNKKDFIYYAGLVGVTCLLAYIVNNIFESNLMFISRNFPGMPIEIIYNNTGKFFTLFMSIIQMTIPFIIIYGIVKALNTLMLKRSKINKNDI